MKSYGYRRDPLGTHKPFRVRYGASIGVDYPDEYLALVDFAPSVQEQDGLEGCVGYAIAEAAYAKQGQLGMVPVMPSPGFIWWNAKKAVAEEAFNVGCYPSRAVATLSDLGMCAASTYVATIQNYSDQPPDIAYTEAYDSKFEIETQELLGDPVELKQEIKAAYHELGPVTLGLAVGQSFEDMGPHSVITEPTDPIRGNHYLATFGYTPSGIITLNSWNVTWGNHGWGVLGWDWVLSCASDIVAFRHVGVIG